MNRTLARLALGLGLSALSLGVIPGAMAQTATDAAKTDAPAAAAPATNGDVSLGVPDGMPDEAHAQPGQIYLAAKFDDWEQRCVKDAQGKKGCQLYQLLKDPTGGPVAEVSFFTLPDGGQAAAGATVVAPLETLLTANLRITIDQAPGKMYPFLFCNPNGCIAKVGFTADEFAAMQKGTTANLTIVPAAAPDKTVQIPVSLKGFSAGFAALKETK